jgi:DNA-damage-inducible protein J
VPKTAELKLRVDPELKSAAAAVYARWGLNLTDAVTMFLHQSVAEDGLPFALRARGSRSFDWSAPSIVRIDSETGHAVLPVDWTAPEDSVYDQL